MSLSRFWLAKLLFAAVTFFALSADAFAQEKTEQPPANPPPRRFGGPRGPYVLSPEVHEDRRVSFRIHAPKADEVRLNAGDMPGDPGERGLKKGENDVWEVTLGPIDPGAYRYTIEVDGVNVVDPKNQSVSESNGNVWSLVHVPGSDFMDAKGVPHGAVARVNYDSTALGRTRRMHIYTPPGYENGSDKYPVFYLLHGAGDCDDSWTSVGRANFILDSLIASGKAKPMIVVMPAGHTGPFSFGAPPPPSTDGRPSLGANDFESDFANDIRPYIEKNYRVLTDRKDRAIAGLSMGGAQTLNVALKNIDDYAYVGVFSSGVFLRNAAEWEKENEAALASASGKEGLKLLWLNTGTDDFLMPRTKETVDLFKKHGFNPVFVESTGGHTWINWRNYLNEFAPQLFQ
ncbi:MAG: alpha/beta hydrolase-fold protein [Planctomycetia bacterium]|nr:alpha/beta hydrolase-fold protein [Planctomycetia bacterium]